MSDSKRHSIEAALEEARQLCARPDTFRDYPEFRLARALLDLYEQLEALEQKSERQATDIEALYRQREDVREQLEAAQREIDRWLTWSGGEYPDYSPGDVIYAYSDGTIILDDGVTTWNPLRALVWIERKAARASTPASRES